MKTRFFASVILFILGLGRLVPAVAVEIAGVDMEETTRVASKELRLNGAGIRHKAIFKVYVAGLYLPERKTSAGEVMSAPGMKRVKIVMLRDVTSEEFARGLMSGIQQNLDRSEKTQLIGQLQKLGEIFGRIPHAYKGQVTLIDWIPGSGTVIQMNGKQIADPIPDIAFYNALLKIWIGDKPLDPTLKPLLLGAQPEETVAGRY